jgi:hypothetical protein
MKTITVNGDDPKWKTLKWYVAALEIYFKG